MSPAQFVTQCVTLWECLIEEAHVAKIGCVKSLSKLRRQPIGQRWQQPLAIGGPLSALLLEFNDMPADVPAGLHLQRIHRPQRLLAGLADQLAETAEQWGEL